jgi:hypothetical protein
MAITTKELGSIVEISKIEALSRKKSELFRTMSRDERIEDLLTEVRRCGDEHLEQLRELVREG